MRELNIDEKSWHYRIAHNYGGYSGGRHGYDICGYTRRFIWGLFIVFVVIAAVSMASLGVLDLLAGLYFSWVAGVWITNFAGTLTAFVITVFSLVIGIIAITEKIRDMRREYRYNHYHDEPGFIKSAYLSWKEKYCIKIKITGDEQNEN